MLPAIVGRAAERRLIGSALMAGRDLLLTGPTGIGKTLLLRHAARDANRELLVVEGGAALTGAALVGHHEPEEVLRRGYIGATFVDGPLLTAMRDGLLLHVEEANRAPPDTLNLLLGPLAERRITVPRMGEVRAAPGFLLLASANGDDPVGSTPLSAALTERLVRLPIGYQDLADETVIVANRVPRGSAWLLEAAVALTRSTREHPDLLSGSSVRGAIDLLLVAERLAVLEDVDLRAASAAARVVVLRAALVVLSGRVTVREASRRSAEEVLRELWEDLLVFRAAQPTGQVVTIPLGSAVVRRPGDRVPPSVPVPDGGEPAAEGGPEQSAEKSTTSGLSGFRRGPAGFADLGAGRKPTEDTEPEIRTSWNEDEITDLADLAAGPAAGRSVRLGHRRQLAGTDSELVARLAVQVIVRRAREATPSRPGPGRLRPARYRFRSDDLDLDRTLAELMANPYPRHEDIWVHERSPDRRAIALLLDVSGSMRGAPLVRAALAAASLSSVACNDDLATVLFWSQVSVVRSVDSPRPVARVIEDILAARPKGLTDIGLGLRTALRQLERSRARHKTGIVVTDGVGNHGGDPLPIAARFPRLHVIATATSESRLEACRRLARSGRGVCVPVNAVLAIPNALTRCLEA